MLNLRKLIKNYKETGALAEQCGVFSFINDWCFVTKTGAVGVVIDIGGIDYECLDQRDLDGTTKRLEAAFKLFGPEFRVYQYLFKSHFQPEPQRDYSNPIVQRAEAERARYFAQKSEEMFSIHLYYVLLYQGTSHVTKMTLTKALRSFVNQGFGSGTKNLKTLFSAKKEIVLIEDEIDQAATILLRQANCFVSHLSDLAEVTLLRKQEAFGMLRRTFNVDPDKQHERLKFDVMTDKYLVSSPLESHTNHLTLDGYHVRVLTLREEPSESRPLVLQQLLRIPSTFHIATEWRAVEQYAFDEGEYGVAETLSRAKNTSVRGMEQAGILIAKGGKARLLRASQLDSAWDSNQDNQPTMWAIVHHLIRVLEHAGERAAAELLSKLGSKAEIARELAYRLYTICERKKRAQEALSYNALVQSWPEILRLAREGAPATQAAMFAQE